VRIKPKTFALFAVLITVSFASSNPSSAQVQTEVPPVVAGAKAVKAEHIKIHGAALEGNLDGEAVDRVAIVLLPPSYDKEKNRRYPVIYALHGFSIGAEQWSHEIHVPQTAEGAFALGAKEMIVVLPDSKTVYGGSMYSSSITTGDFERFIVHDVVEYMDSHYRTIANRTSRGLVGHSMGGYGATRIAMKHPNVFGSVYIMSPCCLSARAAGPANPENEKSPRSDQNPGRCGEAALLPARPACHSGGVVARPEESPTVSAIADKGGSTTGGGACEMGSECATRLHGPIHGELAPVSRNRHRCGRPGWPTEGCRQAARSA
jgi:enterochelin esterase-like enzyme